jgi:hypothetical protein
MGAPLPLQPDSAMVERENTTAANIDEIRHTSLLLERSVFDADAAS